MGHNDTYAELCRQGERFLSPVTEDAKLDARLLLEAVCQTDLTTLLADPERPVSAKEAEHYQELLWRRQNHEPLAYILAEQEFMGLSFRVTPAVLIPNQDTETLVETALEDLKGGERILDLCTGSGCILLSLLYYSKGTVGIGTDLSKEALKIAGENACRLNMTDRAEFAQGDLWEALPEGSSFDRIVSNPPYIARGVIDTLAEEVRTAEPYMALCGGEDGLDFYRRIAAGGAGYLKPGGRLFMEIGYDQGVSVPHILEAYGYKNITVRQDYGGRDRVVTADRPE